MKKFSCEKTIDKPKWIWYNWQTEPQTDFDQTDSPPDEREKKQASAACFNLIQYHTNNNKHLRLY